MTSAAGRAETSIDGSGLGGSLYFLVTAHVDDVESPSGFSTGGAEIDRSQSVCR